MLRELDVRDLGIIEHVHLELAAGLTVLTGETGAGKSLVVRSLQLLAGGRADSEDVRAGADRLVVEGVFDRPQAPEVAAWLADVGVGASGELAVRREVTAAGRSRAWVDDVPVTVATLARLAPALVAIEGQHEQRGLADPASHLALVDAFGVEPEIRERVADAYRRWQEARRAVVEHRRALAGRRDRLDVITFQLNEISSARPREGEDLELEEERALLRNAGRIGELLGTARAALGGEGGSVALARAARAVRELAEFGIGVVDAAEALGQACVLAEDAERVLVALAERVHSNPVRLEEVESRLAILERLARKYGGSLASVLEHEQVLRLEEESLLGGEDRLTALEGNESLLCAAYRASAEELSARRVEVGEAFAGEVAVVLRRLAMPQARIAVRIAPRTDAEGDLVGADGRVRAAADGIDTAELVLSSNPGEPLRPLARIASGGELSRTHLAIRTALRESSSRDPLVLLFDEVDSGIGGRAADELAQLLADLAGRDQVLVVTHLPQVAARAAHHVVVSKEASGGRTVTRVAAVRGDRRVDEIVRMLGGASGSRAVREHARELVKER